MSILDTKDLDDLLEGKRKATNRLEDLILVGYAHALKDSNFIELYFEMIGSEIEHDNIIEVHALCLGYGMGQKKLNEEIAEFNSLEDDIKTNH